MKKIVVALALAAVFLLCTMPAQAIPTSYGTATHETTKWQELAAYENGSLTDTYGVSWRIDGGVWGRDTELYVGQNIEFKFNMHKQNVGTHYADFLKSWLDWGQDGSFNDPDDVIAYGYQELLTNEDGNLGTNSPPDVPDYIFYSGIFSLEEDHIGDLWLRSRVTCSHSLADSMGYGWNDQWGNIDADGYYSGFNPTGWLHQGEVEEWYIRVNAVPEPATMILFGTGLIGLAGLGRKKFFK